MVLWRISNYATSDGMGGLQCSARWHTRGRFIVYLAESAAGALIEMLVHLEIPDNAFPPKFRLLKVPCPETVTQERVSEDALAPEWTKDTRITRTVGDRWIEQSRSAPLAVPSVILPETTNWLLNPRHAGAAQLAVEWHRPFPADGRLFRPRRELCV